MMTLAGTSLSGAEDVLRAGSVSSPSISGSTTAPDANGRGTVTFTESATNITSTYLYYMIDSNTLNLLQIDPNSLGEGRAELRSGTTFSNASVSEGFAFRSGGDTPMNVYGANTLGVFTTDGGGTVTGATYDMVDDGVLASVESVTGTYNVSGNGRVTIDLNPQDPSAVHEIGWLVDSSHGFFLADAVGRVEDGRFDQQQNAPFSSASLNGQFAFYLSGYDTQSPSVVGRIGMLTFDGTQKITFTDYFVNRTGLRTQKGGFTGSYNVDANGRVTASVSGVTKGLVMCLVSNSSGYLMVEDPGAEEPGRLGQSKQP